MSSGGLFHNLVFFIIAIGVLVAFHEFGHYWVARKLKVKVLRFSIGFGKPLLTWRRTRGEDEIEFMIASIPLGGYVKMLDEREGPVEEELKHRAFNNQPVLTRIAIVAAGPVFNFILAILLYSVFFLNGEEGLRPLIHQPAEDTPAWVAGFEAEDEVLSVEDTPVATWQDFRIALIEHGMDGGDVTVRVRTAAFAETDRTMSLGQLEILNQKDDVTQVLGLEPWNPDIPAVLGGTQDNSAAQAAGFQKGDIVTEIGGRQISNWQQLVETVQSNPGNSLLFVVLRDGDEKQITLVPEKKKVGEKLVGFMGAYPQVPAELNEKRYVLIEYGPVEALGRATSETWAFSILMLKVLGKMIVGQAALDNISGPITIAQYAGITASIGLLTYIKFLAMISVSLGVLNLLPVPMLDGGHLMYYLIEIVKGSPVSQKFEEIGQQIGLVLLFMLMSLAIYNDIQRLIN